MRIYVAGASKELARVDAAMAVVREAGHVVTHDWTTETKQYGHLPLSELGELSTEFADQDLRGVRTADLMWLLIPENASTGAWVELGYALASGIQVVASGDRSRCIFLVGKIGETRWFPTDQAAVLYFRYMKYFKAAESV